jgi:hypothetical protein
LGQDNGDHLTRVPFTELMNRGQWRNTAARQMRSKKRIKAFAAPAPAPALPRA